jgi:hypothetical protein
MVLTESMQDAYRLPPKQYGVLFPARGVFYLKETP